MRCARVVTEPITGPRAAGSAAPHRIGTPLARVERGCEVRMTWLDEGDLGIPFI